MSASPTLPRRNCFVFFLGLLTLCNLYTATYIVYITVNGQQTSSWATFSATTPVTPPAVIPSRGSIVPYSDYIPARKFTCPCPYCRELQRVSLTNLSFVLNMDVSASSTSATGSSVGKKVNRQQGQVAAMGVLLAIVGGAVAVW